MLYRKKPRITDRKIRMAIAGCGRISGKHFGVLEHHKDDLELVAICDPDPKNLEAKKKDFPVKAYEDFGQLLEDSQIDMVSLCTPSGLHAEQAIACAAAGKHVLTEKPMATRWKDAQQMVTACDQAGVELFVVKQNRFNPTLRLLKDAVSSGRFGRIFMVTVNVFWTRPQEYYSSSSWRGTWEFDGGALMNQASHYVDLMEWLVGPIESVECQTATLARKIEVEDTCALTLKYRSGALGTASVTMLTYKQNFEGSLTIIGEKGTVRIGGVAVNKVEHWDFEDSRKEDELVRAANYEPENVYGNGHIPYYKNVIDVLKGGAKPITCGREGLRSLEVMIASYLSSRRGERVSLPLEY